MLTVQVWSLSLTTPTGGCPARQPVSFARGNVPGNDPVNGPVSETARGPLASKGHGPQDN